ncbi:hypothetical protein COLO4_23661 [Corchorus olitorius]|uniref:Uncharacterized protein n=1 Tax=Corchorus olitorius TaxID=93759 RepID=A0A1R3IFH6_9ROSI|nr:hypothetical protein COLO4_23661 [Corchorus olitorius]
MDWCTAPAQCPLCKKPEVPDPRAATRSRLRATLNENGVFKYERDIEETDHIEQFGALWTLN